VSFEYRHTRNGGRVVIEEREGALTGRSELVIVAVDGSFSDAEVQEIYADAMAAWLHPFEPPHEWFD
jgi:hypothetical protein